MNAVLSKLNAIALRASQRSDIVIAAFMVLAVMMMIIPLPTALVDVLIGLNIGCSLLILMVAFYISHPVEFSSLPPIILLATLFRLALSITTTRLILLEGDAGQIVSAFGGLVIGGEVVVGLVVFLIIAIAQFLVITKGAERVAEVAARFILDAMPGKQMSIDNDLRNGDIDQAEAHFRRVRLERESQLYGAMDGAMKFVKGDAIATLVILFINLLGGLLIGMLKLDMAFGEAVDVYSVLTVGDGLIAQIPALLIAVAAGTVVTRVGSDRSGSLGTEIVGQLGNNSRALGLTAVILLCLALIPGFATLVFLGLAAGLGLAAWLIKRREQRHQAEEQAAAPDTAAGAGGSAQGAPGSSGADAAAPEKATTSALQDSPHSHHRVVLSLGPSLAEALTLDILRDGLDDTRRQAGQDLGIDIPSVGLRVEPAMEGQHFGIELDEVPVMKGEIPADRLLLDDDPMHLDLLEVGYVDQPPLMGRRVAHWVATQDAERLDDAGIGYWTVDQVLCGCLKRILIRYAGEFIGIQETRGLLSRMEQDYSELVGEAVRVVSLQKMSDILRRLVDEGVPLRALRTILEAMVTWGPQEQNVARLVERIRAALARQICHRHARADRILPAWVMTRPLEETIRGTLRGTEGGTPRGGLPAPLSRTLHAWFQQQLDKLDVDMAPVVIASSDVRPVLQQWSKRHELDLPVMAWQEVAPEFSLQSLAQVRLPKPSVSGGVKESSGSPQE